MASGVDPVSSASVVAGIVVASTVAVVLGGSVECESVVASENAIEIRGDAVSGVVS